MIGKPYKSVTVQLWAAQMDHLTNCLNVTAIGDDCIYVTLEALTEDNEIDAELRLLPDNGYETIVQVIEYCQEENVAEIQFYCN